MNKILLSTIALIFFVLLSIYLGNNSSKSEINTEEIYNKAYKKGYELGSYSCGFEADRKCKKLLEEQDCPTWVKAVEK